LRGNEKDWKNDSKKDIEIHCKFEKSQNNFIETLRDSKTGFWRLSKKTLGEYEEDYELRDKIEKKKDVDYEFINANERQDKHAEIIGKFLKESQGEFKDGSLKILNERFQVLYSKTNFGRAVQKNLGAYFSGKKIKIGYRYADFLFEKLNLQINKRWMELEGSGMQRIFLFCVIQSFLKSQKTENKSQIFFIDEPEVFLHPDLQEKLLESLLEISKNAQVFIATHSPVFIQKETINNVYRFYKDEKNNTKIIHPKIKGEKQKTLIQILHYTNSAKIFFTNKVVLVEGHSDEYFFRCFWNQFKSDKKIEENLEIIRIDGKGNYEKTWKPFLDKFEIRNYFIGDWDNVTEFSILSSSKLSEYKNELKDKCYKKIRDKVNKKKINSKPLFEHLYNFIDNPSLDSDNLKKLKELAIHIFNKVTPYSELIKYIKSKDREEWENIERKIEEKYKAGVFILKEGDLESYLRLKGKDLEEVIKFCNNEKELQNILENEELNEIFSEISN
jgi:predicted ATP-dependent endonuclease of OLD family